MCKKVTVLLLLFGVSVVVHSQSKFYVAPWAQPAFLGFNVLYNYEKLSADDNFNIESNNMLFEIALGYDFGRIVPRLSFDVGIPLFGTVGFSEGDEGLTNEMNTQNLKLGLELGIKPLETERIDLVIPLGVLFCWTTYTQKNPGRASGHPYDRIWAYSYINLFSGVNMTIKINSHIKFGIFSQIGFPVKKELDYRETLHGNYIWTDNNSRTHSEKSDVDVFAFSVGVGILGNL